MLPRPCEECISVYQSNSVQTVSVLGEQRRIQHKIELLQERESASCDDIGFLCWFLNYHIFLPVYKLYMLHYAVFLPELESAISYTKLIKARYAALGLYLWHLMFEHSSIEGAASRLYLRPSSLNHGLNYQNQYPYQPIFQVIRVSNVGCTILIVLKISNKYYMTYYVSSASKSHIIYVIYQYWLMVDAYNFSSNACV